MQAAVVTQMLAIFRSDEPGYQPVHSAWPLRMEDGDPQASLENLKRLQSLKDPRTGMDQGLVIQDIWVRKGLTRVLIQFATGEQYLAFGLRKPEALAFIASEAGFGNFEHLKWMYGNLPADYDSKLPRELDEAGEEVVPAAASASLAAPATKSPTRKLQ
jgi:hypothetical protein